MPWQRDQKIFKESIQNGSTRAQTLFRELNSISASEGLKVYQDSHDTRLAAFLRKDFPVLANLMGERFIPLARAYRFAYPSEFASGTDYGRHFPIFLHTQKWLGLEGAAPELAQLEWNLLELLYAAEKLPTGLEKVAEASESAWAKAKLLFDPSCRILKAEYPLDQIYEQEAWQKAESTDLLLWRKKGLAYYRRLERGELDLYLALAAGLSLGDLSDSLQTIDSALFTEWLQTGIVYGIRWY